MQQVSDSPSARVAATAAAQHGVISHAQLREAGISPSTLTRWVKAGRLTRLHRGLYALGHRSLTRDGWWNAAVLVGGPGSTLTARAGCTIWSVLPHDHGPIDVIPAGRVADPPPWVRVHRTRLAPHERVIRRGLPVTLLTRAIVDLAEDGSDHEVGTALDQALMRGLLHRRELDAAIAAAHGRHGLKVLLPAVRRLGAHGETILSATERVVRNVLLDLDLPRPAMNVRVNGPGRRTCRPDLLWADQRLIVEVDGPQHELPYQQALDRARDAWLTEAGYRVVRFPVEQVDDHIDAVVARIVHELRANPRPLAERFGVIQVVATPRQQPG